MTTLGDRELLKELNRRVRENPDCIVPEGYVKVYEKEQNFKYEVPETVALVAGESYKVGIEILVNGLVLSKNIG